MRRIDRTVSLPYWDSTLDNEMGNPANTILFSTEFLGNGFGVVTTGPFANWTTSEGQLRRNINGGSRLVSRNFINLIMTRCRTRQIARPTATATYDLELEHGGPHVWVGGQMRGINTAAHDPIFFLHHAFIDNIWERFRVRQSTVCSPRINPSTDYPPATGEHAQTRSMDGLPGYRNIDGYRNYWTTTWYRYEPALSCPSCGTTPYITCNTARNVCVSTERRLVAQEGAIAGGRLAFSPAETATSVSAAEAKALDERLTVGPVFDAPPAEPRTQRAQLARIAEVARRAGNANPEDDTIVIG
ncbi:hypothetical protein DPMN_177655 [Dreissena polymorpha]|uniref:Tyrosinase copper-binding domain-containing protein n=2 Tax=Dreissena polymorpha TaxID=45954 RepID=A0A9D4EDF1_DREPO|nr:hypothetical protein DPMN_177655 [Dreissena polymorpha]